MLHPWKTRFALFAVALTLALTGLLAQSPSAYAQGNLPHPRSVSVSQSPWLHSADWLQPKWGNLPPMKP